VLNQNLVMLARIVLHPAYRGLGLAPWFVERSCRSTDWPWIEVLSEMGRFNPFLEKAGFIRVGVSGEGSKNLAGHSVIYGAPMKSGNKKLLSKMTHRKSRYARPVYYVFDNRDSQGSVEKGDL